MRNHPLQNQAGHGVVEPCRDNHNRIGLVERSEWRGQRIMWQPWLKISWRLRLSTVILLTIILGMSLALVIQQRREARLRSALRAARSLNDEAIRVALDRPFVFDVKFLGSPMLSDVLGLIKARTTNGVLW